MNQDTVANKATPTFIFDTLDVNRIPSIVVVGESLSPRQLAARKGHVTRRLRRRLWEKVKAAWAKPRRWQVRRVVIVIKEVKP